MEDDILAESEEAISPCELVKGFGDLSPKELAMMFPDEFANLSVADCSHQPTDALQESLYASIIITLYVVVIVLGAFGNTLVVLTVVRSKQMWNATNIFIANLALADVFVCIFDLPLTLYYQLNDHWAFGAALCHFVLAAWGVMVYVSTLTLAMIAIDRFILIVYPLQSRMSCLTAIKLIVLIFLVAASLTSPLIAFSKYIEVSDVALGLNRKYCTEAWPSESIRLMFTIATAILQFFGPLFLIGVLYIIIFFNLRERMRTLRGRQSRKTKTTKMLILVVLVFAVCWIPYHTHALLTELGVGITVGRYFKFTDMLLRGIALSASCVNPFLYGWMNDNFRNSFLSLLKRQSARTHMIRNEIEESEDHSRHGRTSLATVLSPANIKKFAINRFANNNRSPKNSKSPSNGPGKSPERIITRDNSSNEEMPDLDTHNRQENSAPMHASGCNSADPGSSSPESPISEFHGSDHTKCNEHVTATMVRADEREETDTSSRPVVDDTVETSLLITRDSDQQGQGSLSTETDIAEADQSYHITPSLLKDQTACFV